MQIFTIPRRNLKAWWRYSFQLPQDLLEPRLRRQCRNFRWMVYFALADVAFLFGIGLGMIVRHYR